MAAFIWEGFFQLFFHSLATEGWGREGKIFRAVTFSATEMSSVTAVVGLAGGPVLLLVGSNLDWSHIVLWFFGSALKLKLNDYKD